MQVGFWKDMKREKDEDEAAHAALGAELAREYPDHLPLLAARVASLAALTGDKRAARLQVRTAGGTTEEPVKSSLVGIPRGAIWWKVIRWWRVCAVQCNWEDYRWSLSWRTILVQPQH